MTDIDIEAILFHLQKQTLLPASELLNMLDIATQHGRVSKCHEAMEVLRTVEVDKQMVEATMKSLTSAAQGIHLKKTLSITDLLHQLPEYLGQFKSSITQTEILSNVRQSFALLKEVLNNLERLLTQPETLEPLPQGVVHELCNIFLDAVNELMPGKVSNTKTKINLCTMHRLLQ